ncbi:MAG: hypothetical protein SO101_08165 [Lachnospiraceae bacterium]|nr:hypothetical protein [Lachnospiraceae bacterium]
MSIHMNSDSTPVSGHLDIRHFSSRFTVRFLREEDIPAVYDFCLGNPQSEVFWLKNRFVKTGAEKPADGYTVVQMERML